LKDPKDFTLIGTRAKRVDSSIKVDGRALYGIDARLPGMKVAAVAISPVLGGKAKTVDENAALAVKGVRQVVNSAHAEPELGQASLPVLQREASRAPCKPPVPSRPSA
jgi:CO/xanthine dehydrogenase Mo-binding subunit